MTVAAKTRTMYYIKVTASNGEYGMVGQVCGQILLFEPGSRHIRAFQKLKSEEIVKSFKEEDGYECELIQVSV